MKNMIIFVDELDSGGISKISFNINSMFKDVYNCNIVSNHNYNNYNEVKALNAENFFVKIYKIRNLVKQKSIDIIITNTWRENIMIYLSVLLCKKKVVIVQILHYDYSQLRLNNKNFIINYIKKELIKLSFKLSKKCISVSKDACDELNENLKMKNRFLHIYNPVIDENIMGIKNVKSRILKKKKEYNLVCIGWIREAKGQETIIESLNIIKKEGLPIKMNFIGGVKEQKYKEKLLENISKYKLEKNVIFHGELDDVQDILKNMDVLIVASKCEALPTVIIEAIALGIPVISSDCKHGPKEILENGRIGMLYNVDNYVELSNCIVKLLTDETSYRTYSSRGIEKSNVFKYNNIKIEYCKCIEGLVGGIDGKNN